MPTKKPPLKKTIHILEPELIEKIKAETYQIGFGEFAQRCSLSPQGLRTLIRRGRAHVSTVKRILKVLTPVEQEVRVIDLTKRTVEQELIENRPNLLSSPPTIRELLEDVHNRQQAMLELLGALQRDVADLKSLWS